MIALVAPAKWNTQSTPLTASAKEALSLQSPGTNSTGRPFSHFKSLVFRRRQRTCTPFRISASVKWLPINPVPPVTRAFNGFFFLTRKIFHSPPLPPLIGKRKVRGGNPHSFIYLFRIVKERRSPNYYPLVTFNYDLTGVAGYPRSSFKALESRWNLWCEHREPGIGMGEREAPPPVSCVMSLGYRCG